MKVLNQSIENSTVKKTMLRILPFLFICYVIAYLDRINLGFAALEMNADLTLSAEAFGLLSGIFFIGYMIFEIPSNMIMHKVGAKIWIARILITWGIISVCTAFVQTAMHLYIARFLLGIAEAGFFPGIILYLTYWFRSKERARASAAFMLAWPVCSIVGAPVSIYIMDNITWGGLAGWRWMFVLEGLPAIILGIVTFFYLENRPENAKWLSGEEKNWLENELRFEKSQSHDRKETSKLEMFKGLKIWKLSFVCFTIFCSMYALAFFLPTIIKSLSTELSNTDIGRLSIIPPIVGIPSMIFWAWSSDKRNERIKHLVACCLITASAFTIGGFMDSAWLLMVSISIVAIGLMGLLVLFVSYVSMSFTESTAPIGIATVNTLGSLGGFVGPFLFGMLSFSKGMFLIGALIFLSSVILLTFRQSKGVKIKVDPDQSL
ncbi:MFS transporter [Gottfriedia acidiceleris]|uniref:MFS transporter n=1 Tax=Gottfriedia acidiceleris TaxID=371036 RepID=UPI003D2596D4